MIAGSTPATGPGDDPGQRLEAATPDASVSGIRITTAAPSLIPEALAAVTEPSLSKAGLSFVPNRASPPS